MAVARRYIVPFLTGFPAEQVSAVRFEQISMKMLAATNLKQVDGNAATAVVAGSANFSISPTIVGVIAVALVWLLSSGRPLTPLVTSLKFLSCEG